MPVNERSRTDLPFLMNSIRYVGEGDGSRPGLQYRILRQMQRQMQNQLGDLLPSFDEQCLSEDEALGTSSDDAFEHEPSTSSVETPQEYVPICSCSYLQPGQVFKGSQQVQIQQNNVEQDWPVTVTIQRCDMASGYVCGVMEAQHSPTAPEPVLTWWEGEIIDNINHSFLTQKYNARRDHDMEHWKRFHCFRSLRHQVERENYRCAQLATCSHVFMRWKEQCFLNAGRDVGLTIEGFYYVCLDRQTGEIESYYFDANNTRCYQKLQLKPFHVHANCGFTSGSFAFA